MDALAGYLAKPFGVGPAQIAEAGGITVAIDACTGRAVDPAIHRTALKNCCELCPCAAVHSATS